MLKKTLGLTAAPLAPEKARSMSLRVPRGILTTAVDPPP